MLEVAFGGKFCLLISEKAEAVFPCASVSHWVHFATSPAPARVRLVVFSCPCRDWIQSRGEGNLALLGCHVEVQMGEPVMGWFGGRVDGESPEIRLIISVTHKN